MEREPGPTTIIQCDCRVCNGLRAEVRVADGRGYGPTVTHNFVRLAHSPLASAASARRFGPWPVTS